MKSILTILLVISMMIPSETTKHKPYVLAIKAKGTIASMIENVKTQLKSEGFEILGVYSPAKDINRKVICVTTNEIEASIKTVGGLTGFAGALRVALTVEGGDVFITYTNPYYWGNAYFRADYVKVENNYKIVNNKFIRAMKKIGTFEGKFYGSKEGISEKDLREYQYMTGMPEFDEVVEIKSYPSFADAKKAIDGSLAKTSANYSKVYELEIPGKNLKVYGIALTGTKGESSFLPKIDISSPKHGGFLPYELLINGNKVVMMHGRYRIAVAFPDLTMGTFTKIMSAPGDIESTMKEICK